MTPIKDIRIDGEVEIPNDYTTALLRSQIAIQDRNGTTPFTHRRFEAGAGLRVLIFGDSIAPGVLLGTTVGVLRQLQRRIGNAGGGGGSIDEAFWQNDGATAFLTAGWFMYYASVPAASSVEWSGLGRVRRLADTAQVLWKAPVGGVATFKIQYCSDADGAGVGTWVDDPAGVRTAVAVGGNDEVRTATLPLAIKGYRLRVVGISGTVEIVGMELSVSAMNGCVILNVAQDGSLFSQWAGLTATQRAGLITGWNPDVIFVIFKDTAADMATALEALRVTNAGNLNGGYLRDVVLLAAFPSVAGNDPMGHFGSVDLYEQREVMRKWACVNRATFVDLWDTGPARDVYFADGIHLAGAREHAHVAQLVLERLGWLRYQRVEISAHFKALVKTPGTGAATIAVATATVTLFSTLTNRISDGKLLWDATASKTRVIPAGWYDFTLAFPADVTLWSLYIYKNGALLEIVGNCYGSRPVFASSFEADGVSIYDFRVEQFSGGPANIYDSTDFGGLKIIRRIGY